MMANVVVIVNASMSAAASTPVYLAITGAAARSVTVSRWRFHASPGVLPIVHVIRHWVDTCEGLLRAGLDVGDVLLVHRDIVAGREPAQVPADEVRPGVGQGDFGGLDVALHVLADRLML